MTPERLTYQTQTPYARGGGNFMVDAGTQEMAGMQNFNQALRASEKRAAEIAEAEKQAQKEAKKAAAEAAEMKMDKLLQKQKKEEEQEKTKGKKEGEKETGETYEGKEGGETVKEAAALKARVEKYFPQKIPSSVAKEAQVFYDNAGGKPLPEVTTKELTKGYVRCRSEAEKNEERLDFLSEIKKELEGRGVNAEGTYKASTEYYMQLLKGEHEKLVKERALSAESQAKKALVEEELEKQGKVIEKIKGGLREEWYAEFTEKELRDPDTRSTIEAAIEKGYHPKSVTSKRAVKQVAEDVVRNALIEDKQTRERAHELLEKENLSPAEEIEILATHSERLNRAEIILQTKLTEKQKMAIIKAHYTGKGGVFGYLERELLEKGRILNEAFTRAQREALIEAGIAAEPINVPGAVNNTSLINIKADIDAEAARLGANREFSADYLEQQRTRIQNLVDQGTVPAADAEQARRFVNSLNERIDAAQQTYLQERARGERDELPQLYVDPDSRMAQELDPGQYEVQEVKDEATEIKAAIERSRDPRRKEVDNEYLRNKVDSFVAERDRVERDINTASAGTDITGLEKKANEIRRLISQVQAIKDYLVSEERREFLEKNPRGAEGLYGDIKLTSGERKELVQLALEDNVEELKRHFNKLFESAAARTSDSWREAGGQRQAFEVDSFTKGLDDVSSKRVAYKDSKQIDPATGRPGKIRELTDDEVARLRKVSRELAQEVKLRELLHDVTYYANKDFGIEDLRKLTGKITADEVDYAFRTPGVAKVAHYFENAMLQVMAENGGVLPSEAMVNEYAGGTGRVERLVRDQIKIEKELGLLDIDDWQIERAISMARGMNIVTFRTFEIVAKHGIPPASGGVLVNWWANNIIKKFAFFRQLARYDVGFERNKFLTMRIENRGKVWRTKELEELKSLSTGEILNKFVNESDDDRFIDMVNPAQAGSVFTQTGWRWVEEPDYHAGAIAALLDGYMFNPIIGAGMWIEKRRRAWDGNKKLSQNEIDEARLEFGESVSNQAELSKLLIDRNLILAKNATPLKLFYNMTGLRQQVLRDHYSGSIKEGVGGPGRIFIKEDAVLKKDLETLSVIQEGLIRKRVDEYKKFAAGKIARPKLYEDLASIQDEIRSLSTKLNTPEDPNQVQRLLEFVDHVQTEFDNTKLNRKGRLMGNIKDKGWKEPFIFGTDDIPYDIYEISKTGNSLDRRWGDNESAAQAAEVFQKELLEKMSEFKDQATIVATMKKIHDVMKGHDEHRTRDFMLYLSEAMIKFYKKDYLARMPAGMGLAKGLLGGFIGKHASYARIAFGPNQMAWDEIDIDEFIKRVHGAGLIEPEDFDKLRKRAGAKGWNLGFALTRTAIPLGILGFLYYMLTTELKNMKLAA